MCNSDAGDDAASLTAPHWASDLSASLLVSRHDYSDDLQDSTVCTWQEGAITFEQFLSRKDEMDVLCLLQDGT